MGRTFGTEKTGKFEELESFSFGDIYKKLKDDGMRTASFKDLAELLLKLENQQQIDYLTNHDFFLNDSFIYVSKNGRIERTYLSNESYIFKNKGNAKKASRITNGNESPKEFGVKSSLTKNLLISTKSYNIKETESFYTPTNRFGEEDATLFLFEDENLAKEYGLFLKDRGIKKLYFKLPQKLFKSNLIWPESKTRFVRQSLLECKINPNYINLRGDKINSLIHTYGVSNIKFLGIKE